MVKTSSSAAEVLLVAVGIAGAMSGCGPSNGQPESIDTSLQVMALSAYSARLGTPIDVYVKNLPKPTEGAVSLHLKGRYTRADGTTEVVNLLDPLKRVDGATLRWINYGPFYNPFTQDQANPQTGIFQGVLTVRVVAPDGTVKDDPQTGQHVTFEVRPSIIIEDFQPITAQCDAPAKRAFGALSYRVRARAMGFVPHGFTYTLRTPTIKEVVDPMNPTATPSASFELGPDQQIQWADSQVRHDNVGTVDQVDGDDALRLPRIPGDANGYKMVLLVDSVDEAGTLITTQFGMSVGRPIEFSNQVHYALAQLYTPKPMTGCMPGGPQGRIASYTDSQAETRQRSFTFTLSQNWVNSVTHSQSEGFQNTWSSTDGLTLSRSVTDTSGWSTSESDSHSTTKSRSDTTGESVTNGITVNGSATKSNTYNESNAFSFNLNGAHTDGSGVTIGSSDDKGHTDSGTFELGASGKGNGGIELNAIVVKVNLGGELGGSTKKTWGNSDSTGHTDSQDNTTTQADTNGWSLGDTQTQGSSNTQSQTKGGSKSSSATGSASTTTGSASTVSHVDSQSLNGSTASTEGQSASHTDSTGGGTSKSSSVGTTNSEGEGNQASNGWTASSTQVVGKGFTGQIVAGTFGVFYRQMARYDYTNFLIEYDKCGNGEVAGIATLDDYTWAVDLAQHASCPPFPATDFPTSQCFLNPCTEDDPDAASGAP
jgi:hypothetical protein